MLSSFALVSHARDLSAEARVRAVSDAVALAAVVDPGHGATVARANHAVLRNITITDNTHGTVCVVVQVGSTTQRSCAELLTPTLDD